MTLASGGINPGRRVASIFECPVSRSKRTMSPKFVTPKTSPSFVKIAVVSALTGRFSETRQSPARIVG
jgi:hypothetical protein